MNSIPIRENSMILKVIKGVTISVVISMIGVFLLAVVLTYSNVQENIIPIAIIFLTCISILIATIISTKKISKNGMINGGVIGVSYVVLLYLISSILNTGFQFNVYTMFMIICGVIAGIIGGIIGINL